MFVIIHVFISFLYRPVYFIHLFNLLFGFKYLFKYKPIYLCFIYLFTIVFMILCLLFIPV